MTKSQEAYANRSLLDLVGSPKQQLRIFTGLRKQYLPINKKGDVVLTEAHLARYGVHYNQAGNITQAAFESALADELKVVEGKYTHMSRFCTQRICLQSDEHEKLFVKQTIEGVDNYVPATVYARKEVPCNRFSGRIILDMLRQSFHISDELAKESDSLATYEKTEVFYRKVTDGEKTEWLEVKRERTAY